jgi:hypothetical protein
LDAESVSLEQLGQPGDGLALLVGNLGIRVNVSTDSFELRPQCVDPGANGILELAGRRLSD